jgi:hypothetical protein
MNVQDSAEYKDLKHALRQDLETTLEEQLSYILERAKYYSELTGVGIEPILEAWKDHRHYWNKDAPKVKKGESNLTLREQFEQYITHKYPQLRPETLLSTMEGGIIKQAEPYACTFVQETWEGFLACARINILGLALDQTGGGK